MPHGQFTNVTLNGDGRLLITGKSVHHEGIEEDLPSAIQIAVIALDDHEKRSEAKCESIGTTWPALAPCQTDGHGEFGEGDDVILIGAATHSVYGFPNPFIWHDFFCIGAAGSRTPHPVTVVVPT
jgi:hypothetical protein